MFLFIEACSGLKHLPKGEKLYTGAEIKVESTDKIDKRSVKNIAQAAVRPLPNKTFLGMRPKLWKYMQAGENPKTKLKKWYKKRGEAPVLISDVKPAVTSAIIDAKLFNVGIFKSYTESKIVEKKQTAKVIYISHVHKPYTVSELSYAISDDSISQIILTKKEESLIKPGKDYNLLTLENERTRIDTALKNHGYFYFNPDYLLFKADTSAVNHTISLKLTLKDSIPQNALRIYRINNVIIDENYSLNEDVGRVGRSVARSKDTIKYLDYLFLSQDSLMKIKPGAILRSVYLKKNEIYSRQNHNITLNRLMSMGNFKFVQVKFSESDTITPGFLDAAILMTPMPIHTFRAELDLVSKSNNFTGPKMNLSLLNRNTFGGAELLNLSLAGSFEAQFSGANKNQYSYSWNPQIALTFPRFIVPFKMERTRSLYIPKTEISFSYNFQRRVNYFDMQTFQFIYGFKWKENIRTEHELNPLNVSYTSIGNQSPAFIELLAGNPYLKKSYEEHFIAGGNYSFTYNEQVVQGKKMQYFFQSTAETAGNILSLIKLVSGENPSSANPSKLIGSIYSQYAKFSIDARGYYNFRDKNMLAFRFFAGVARPFGNSSIIPYSKQFFSGGPNSIRAFQFNSVGPGTYFQDVNKNVFLQLGGDIKLEMNGEYRFNIYRFLKGAMFLDAGNVWLEKSSPANIGSPFLLSTFMKELAVGTGIGLRFDVSFFILRFDLAMPLRKPWLDENHRWVIDQIDFASSSWRGQNLILNIAIGYPF